MKGNRHYERIVRTVRARHAGCPEAEDLQTYEEGRLAPARRQEVASHVSGCPACAEAIRFLEAERAGATEEADLPLDVATRDETVLEGLLEDARTARPEDRRPPGRVWVGAAAAGILLAAALGTWFLNRDRPPAGYREPVATEVRALVPDGAILSRGDLVLRWEAPAGSRCGVVLFAEDLHPLARGNGITSGEWRVPPEALAGVPEGGKVFWQVDALLPDGTRARSETWLIRLR